MDRTYDKCMLIVPLAMHVQTVSWYIVNINNRLNWSTKKFEYNLNMKILRNEIQMGQ